MNFGARFANTSASEPAASADRTSKSESLLKLITDQQKAKRCEELLLHTLQREWRLPFERHPRGSVLFCRARGVGGRIGFARIGRDQAVGD